MGRLCSLQAFCKARHMPPLPVAGSGIGGGNFNRSVPDSLKIIIGCPWFSGPEQSSWRCSRATSTAVTGWSGTSGGRDPRHASAGSGRSRPCSSGRRPDWVGPHTCRRPVGHVARPAGADRRSASWDGNELPGSAADVALPRESFLQRKCASTADGSALIARSLARVPFATPLRFFRDVARMRDFDEPSMTCQEVHA